jgi:hypothetical protein
MAAETDISGQVPAPDGPSSEWHPTRTTWILWLILSLPILYVGAVVYTTAALHGETPRSSGTVEMGALMVVLLLGFGLMWVHEGVHGIFMLAFGARPKFGMLRIGLLPYAFYTTDPGHRFTRRQYLAVSLAPLAILGLLGVPLCMLSPYLVVPFAFHLAGCVGDIAISRHVLQGPPTVVCEDLRDGVRFWKPAA